MVSLERKLGNMEIVLKDSRLANRWGILVRAQMKVSSDLAAGVGVLPDSSSALAATQAAWRFYSNDRIELRELVVPLRDHARARISSIESCFVLLAHDWCKLRFPGHKSRKDMAELSNQSDIGYELTTALAISPDQGEPLAPLEMHMKMRDGMLSTQGEDVKSVTHLDQILPIMEASKVWNLGKPIVHIIDREADSIGHYREWDAAGHKVLIRADDRRVMYEGKETKLSKIRDQMTFQDAGPALYHGKEAYLQVCEAAVVLHRPARKSINKERIDVPGVPLPMRAIFTRVVSAKGEVLAQWYLLSNVPADWADAGKLAMCYYWRWRIESYFKLLKSHGFQLEDWLQETADAIARRILVVSMAAVTVWQLMADQSAPATQLKRILIRLSGRQTKRSRPVTAPALLAGLCTMLSMLYTLETHSLDSIKSLVDKVNLPIPLLKTK